MKIRFALLAAALMLPCAADAASAQDSGALPARPMFVTLPQHAPLPQNARVSSKLKQWNGSFTDLTNKTIHFTMVGLDPSRKNKTTTVQVYIIPIKMVYGVTNGNMTFDPATHTVANGNTVVQDVIASPLFDPGVNFTQGGTNLGTTQYIDAFQRGNFWSSVSTNSNYHVLLGNPTVLAEQTINVTKTQGQVETDPITHKGKVGTMDINAFDAKLQSYLTSFAQINPGVLPIFITYDVYLTEGSCCIGGYHDSDGSQPTGQTYSYATYEDPNHFSQDVSALSHEIGEWMDDPFVDNHVNCNDNSILEVGDPLEREANYGGFPYVLNGSTYNLQSLVFLGYFGAPPSTSVNSWLSFQNDEAHVCPGQ